MTRLALLLLTPPPEPPPAPRELHGGSGARPGPARPRPTGPAGQRLAASLPSRPPAARARPRGPDRAAESPRPRGGAEAREGGRERRREEHRRVPPQQPWPRSVSSAAALGHGPAPGRQAEAASPRGGEYGGGARAAGGARPARQDSPHALLRPRREGAGALGGEPRARPRRGGGGVRPSRGCGGRGGRGGAGNRAWAGREPAALRPGAGGVTLGSPQSPAAAARPA